MKIGSSVMLFMELEL